MLSAYAQAESESRSQNIKLGIKNQIENGTSKLYNRPCYGYRHNKDGNLEVIWQQALVVQKIFDYYLEGARIKRFLVYQTMRLIMAEKEGFEPSRTVFKTIPN